MCGCMRPNEAFSGRNHRRHLCRACARQPRAERDRSQKLRNLWEMLLRQSNISERNIAAAAGWANDPEPEVGLLARLVVDIGRVHPRRRRRHGHIRQHDPALFQRMIAAGLVAEDLAEQHEWEPPHDWEPPAEPEEPTDGGGEAFAVCLDEEGPF
jgi:hypothetical protein